MLIPLLLGAAFAAPSRARSLGFEADLATGAATYVSVQQGLDQRFVATFTGCRLEPR